MNPALYMAIAAVPSTMLTVASVASATNAISGDKGAVQLSVYTTGTVLILASFFTREMSVVAATALAVGASIAVVNPIWFGKVGI